MEFKQTLKGHFHEIKRLFFPRWDRDNAWKVTKHNRRAVHGQCDPERKVISIVAEYETSDERDRLFIHEICHGVASCADGGGVASRMEMAAKRADELNRDQLAILLRDDITGYQNAPKAIGHAYDMVEQWVLDEPAITLAEVKRALAYEHGLLLSEVLPSFRRLPKVFDKAKRVAEQYAKLQRQFLANHNAE